MADQKNKGKKKRARWKVIVFGIVRWIRVPVMCAIALIGGLLIGYVYMGGKQPDDVFHVDTWRHMIDLVFDIS